MADTNTGRFVWYELMTTDAKAAIAFYCEVVGWKTQAFGDGGGDDAYTMWVSSQGPLGGVMTLPEAAKQMGATPKWLAHVGVADVDATVAKVRELGGRVFREPSDIPTIGRFAVIADPQGAAISVFKPEGAQQMCAHDPLKPGTFNWHELVTTDHEAALRFYGALFGWQKLAEFNMGPMGMYLLFGLNDKQIGGMMTKPKDNPMPTAWLYYVQVADLDAAVATATARGAKLLHGPADVPSGTRIAQLLDPQGVAFALHGDGAKA